MADIKWSQFPSETPDSADVVVGLHAGGNARFTLANIVVALRQGLASIFVPLTRTINGKALNDDISLNASDVGAVATSEKGVAGGVAELGNDGKVPSVQLPAIASTAADVTYDNTTSGLQADDVQEALDELAAGAGGSTASTTTYDNTDSGLSATNVQDAIDEIVDEKADQATVAPRETTTTATAAHDLGTTFYLNGVLCRALSDIAIGDTINTTAGGNATQTTVAENFSRIVKLTSSQYAQLSAAEKAADIVYIVTDKPASYVPLNGMGKNLLDNWYFITPVNQRGLTTYTAGDYCIDRWKNSWEDSGTGSTVTLTSSGCTLTPASSSVGAAVMIQPYKKAFSSGDIITISALMSDGTLLYHTFTISSATSYEYSFTYDSYTLKFMIVNNFRQVRIYRYGTGITIAAVKLEYGTQQTLAHFEGSTWVLNEIPNYNDELIKCQTSTADTSDTYANKTMANEQELAYVETGSTASRAYSIGEYFTLGGKTCRAKTAIPQGATLTLDTNYEVPGGGGLNDISFNSYYEELAHSTTTGAWQAVNLSSAISKFKYVYIAATYVSGSTKIDRVCLVVPAAYFKTKTVSSNYIGGFAVVSASNDLLSWGCYYNSDTRASFYTSRSDTQIYLYGCR